MAQIRYFRSIRKNCMRKDRRGAMLLYLATIGLLIASFTFLTLKVMEKPAKWEPKYVGEHQLALLKTAINADKFLLFIDQASKPTAMQSIYNLAQKGGFPAGSECGQYIGYQKWRTFSKDSNEMKNCIPDESTIKYDISYAFNNELYKYLNVYWGYQKQNAMAVNAGSGDLAGKTVILDPGHGEGYSGPSGASGEQEATHAISAKLKMLLEQKGAIVYETPSAYGMTERANFANEKKGDILVSIHFNGVSDVNTAGLEAFYGAENSGTADGSPEKDKVLCENIIPKVKDVISSELRGGGIKPDTGTDVGSLSNLRKTNMPACLIEMEFISAKKSIKFNNKEYGNYKDLFRSEDYQNAAANALKEGIINYFSAVGNLQPEPKKPEPSLVASSGMEQTTTSAIQGLMKTENDEYITGTPVMVPYAAPQQAINLPLGVLGKMPPDNYEVNLEQKDKLKIMGIAKDKAEFDIVLGEIKRKSVAKMISEGVEGGIRNLVDIGGCSIDSPQTDSQSIGNANVGRLENGVKVPDEGTYYLIDPPARGRGSNYATNELYIGLQKTGCVLMKNYNVKLIFRDMSKQGGGKLGKHLSHTSGRDVDMGFVCIKDEKRFPCYRNVVQGGGVVPEFDPAGNWLLMKTVFDTVEVDHVFLNRYIIKLIMDWAEANEPDKIAVEKVKKILERDELANHVTHYHLRIKCPEGDAQCRID
ncbi:hypothetical protein COV19_06540 [Candidatus Woesearchaeota archaeon CG10_big_fil_rev_8_21_14_0_10_44_13]|nr:MAG: hypothetical protein COV19_06540 [Candidatus Woesearchaeota archaeon CG10_big_fil_rev_8_21_14_0_10_44_13]